MDESVFDEHNAWRRHLTFFKESHLKLSTSGSFSAALCTAIVLASMSLSQTVSATPASATPGKEMSCLVGVMTAKDLVNQADDLPTVGKPEVVTVPLVNGEGEQEVLIGGEQVYVGLSKREYVDVYNVVIQLKELNHDPRVPMKPFVVMNDFLEFAGPAKNDPLTVKPGLNAVQYDYMNYEGGAFTFSNKFRDALNAEAKWGAAPLYNSATTAVQYMQAMVEDVRSLLKNGKLQDSDVLGIYHMLSCTLN